MNEILFTRTDEPADSLMDTREDRDDDLLHPTYKRSFVKREIRRARLNRLEDFIAETCDDVYSDLVDISLKRRKRMNVTPVRRVL